MKTAVCSGSFDPITLGHLDIIRRAAACFDRVWVCVSPNAEKRSQMFTPEQKLHLVQTAVADLPHVEAELWPGLLADYAVERGACTIVRGVRNGTDYDVEAQLAAINRGIRSGAGHAAAASQPGVSALQLLHGPGDDPLPPAAGALSAGIYYSPGAADD